LVSFIAYLKHRYVMSSIGRRDSPDELGYPAMTSRGNFPSRCVGCEYDSLPVFPVIH